MSITVSWLYYNYAGHYWCFTLQTSYIQYLNGPASTSGCSVGIAPMQRIKQRINVPPSRPTPGTVNPLPSSNLSGIKTSIALLNINVCWTLNTFEPAQRCRIKEVPFKGLFPPDHRAQSRLSALWWSHYKLFLYLRFIRTLCCIISGDLCKYFRSPQTD